MINLNQVHYSPDSSTGKTPEELKKEELEQIKSKVSLIDPRNPNYEEVGLGIEITTKGFNGINLDHHKEGDTQETPSAIEQAYNLKEEEMPLEIKEGKKKMATVRPDLDSVGAMATILLKLENKEEKINKKLIEAIGILDRMGPGVFKKEGKELLELTEEEFEKVNKICKAASYNVLIKLRNLPLEEKVYFMKKLLTDEIDEKEIESLYEENEKDLEKAKKESKIEDIIDEEEKVKVVFIEGSNLRAMEIGYEHAPVIIAYNPQFKWPDGHITPKFTIARYDKYVKFDIKSFLEELKKKNPKWGGQENIIGSPQGEDPNISKEEMIELVKKYLG